MEIALEQKKAVSFGLIVEVKCFDRLEKEHMQSLWYSKHDLAEIKKEIKLTIRLLKTNKPLPPEYCERGLEMYSNSVLKFQQFQACRLGVVQVVMNEQIIQRCIGICDNMSIGRIASATSIFSKQAAIQQANLDYYNAYCLVQMNYQHHPTHDYQKVEPSFHLYSNTDSTTTVLANPCLAKS